MMSYGVRRNVQEETGIPFLRDTFSYERFFFIEKSPFVIFATVRNKKKLTKTWLFVNFIRNSIRICKNSYCLYTFVRIDDMLIGFRSHCSFISISLTSQIYLS